MILAYVVENGVDLFEGVGVTGVVGIGGGFGAVSFSVLVTFWM